MSALWDDAAAASRLATGWALAGLLLAGLPLVGLAVAVIALVLARRARAQDVDKAGHPQRLATIAMLLAVLGTILSALFSTALLILLALG